MRTLSTDEIATLLKVPDGPKDHYVDYDRSHWPETFECSICGACETPEACVWSAICPRCNSGIGEYCTGADGRLVSLHIERHDAALINAKVFRKTTTNL
jgi:hypothetical protein